MHPGDTIANGIVYIQARRVLDAARNLFAWIPFWNHEDAQILSEEDVLQDILDWACSEDDNEFEITLENADKIMVSFEACCEIAKGMRDTLKGSLLVRRVYITTPKLHISTLFVPKY